MKTEFIPADNSIHDVIQGYLYIDYTYKEPSKILMTAKGTCSLSIPLALDFTFENRGNKLKINEAQNLSKITTLLYGQMTSYGYGYCEGHIKFLFVVFTPAGLYRFLNREIYSLTNCIYKLENIIALDFDLEQIEASYQKYGVHSVINLVEEKIKAHISLLPEEKPATNLNSALAAIHKGLGKIQISDLAALYGKTQRAFELQFKKQIGLPPKVYCRITRFNQLIFMLSDTPNLDSFEWIEKFGYSDQSHFIKDFKDFTGMTPRNYFKSASWENQLIDKALRQ